MTVNFSKNFFYVYTSPTSSQWDSEICKHLLEHMHLSFNPVKSRKALISSLS